MVTGHRRVHEVLAKDAHTAPQLSHKAASGLEFLKAKDTTRAEGKPAKHWWQVSPPSSPANAVVLQTSEPIVLKPFTETQWHLKMIAQAAPTSAKVEGLGKMRREMSQRQSDLALQLIAGQHIRPQKLRPGRTYSDTNRHRMPL